MTKLALPRGLLPEEPHQPVDRERTGDGGECGFRAPAAGDGTDGAGDEDGGEDVGRFHAGDPTGAKHEFSEHSPCIVSWFTSLPRSSRSLPPLVQARGAMHLGAPTSRPAMPRPARTPTWTAPGSASRKPTA